MKILSKKAGKNKVYFLLENLTVRRKHYNEVRIFKPEKMGNFTPELTYKGPVPTLLSPSAIRDTVASFCNLHGLGEVS